MGKIEHVVQYKGIIFWQNMQHGKIVQMMSSLSNAFCIRVSYNVDIAKRAINIIGGIQK